MTIRLVAALLFAFCGVYLIRMAMLRRRRIAADVMGKGDKPKGAAILEIALKCVTYAAYQRKTARYLGVK